MEKMKDKKISRRDLLKLSIPALASFGLGYLFKGVAAQTSQTIRIQPGSFTEVCSYIIFKNGDIIYARDGKTGEVCYLGGDAASIIQMCIDALPNDFGGRIFIKNGDYNITKTINVTKKYIEIFGESRGKTALILAADIDKMFYVSSQATMFTLCDLRIDGNKNNRTIGTGVYVDQTSDVIITRCFINAFKTRNLDFRSAWGPVIADNYIEGSGGEGLYLLNCYGSLISRNTFNWNLIGLVLASGGGRGNMVVQNTIRENSQHGIKLAGTTNSYIIIGNYIKANSKSAVNSYSGISLEDTPTNNIILGNLIDGELSGTNYHKYGIVGVSAAVDNIIAQNIIRNSVTAAISMPSGNLIFKNKGFATENSGVATIPANQTSVAVAHGLAGIPSKVIVTPRANIGNVWVSARDSTNITINCSSAPSIDTQVDWYAEL